MKKSNQFAEKRKAIKKTIKVEKTKRKKNKKIKSMNSQALVHKLKKAIF